MQSLIKSAYGVGAVSKPQACRTKTVRFVVLLSHVQQFEVHGNQFFANIYQFVVVTAHIDVQNSRSGDFCDDDRRQTKPIALPIVHVRG